MARKSSAPIEQLDEPPELIQDCIGPVDPKKPLQGPWRYGILAADTVAFTSGRLARAGDEVRHDVAPAELKLCRKLADEVYGIYPPPLASEGGFDWDRFFVAANRDEPVPERIDEALIRTRFGGTILPVAPIAVSPIDESGRWWEEISRNIGSCRDHVTRDLLKISLEEFMARSLAGGRALVDRGLTRYGYSDGSGQTEEGDQILREIMQVPEGERLFDSYTDAARQFMKVLNLEHFFKGPDFLDAAFVEIGEEYARFDVDRALWPAGLESWPSCFPRLLVGLTTGGSLAGVFGYVVAT